MDCQPLRQHEHVIDFPRWGWRFAARDGSAGRWDRQAATFAAPHDSRRKLCYAPRFISGTMDEIGRNSLILALI